METKENVATEGGVSTLSEVADLLREGTVVLTTLPPKNLPVPEALREIESSLRQFLSESGFIEVRPLLFVADSFSEKVLVAIDLLEAEKESAESQKWLKFLGLIRDSEDGSRVVHVLADLTDRKTTIKVWDCVHLATKEYRAA